MSLFLRNLCLVWAVFFLSSSAHSFVISSGDQRISLNAYLSYYEDEKGLLELDDVVQLQRDGRLVENNEETLNFGFSDSVYWVRVSFSFADFLNSTESWIVSLDYAPLRNIDLYVLNGESIEHIKAGTDQPFNSRPILYRNFAYPLVNQGGSEYELWLKISSDSSIQIPLTLWPSQIYFEEETLSSYGWGIFCGILLALTLYNLFLYVSVKDPTYLFYVMYLLGMSGVVLFLNGLGFQLIWPESEEVNRYALLVFSGLSILGALQFSRSFLGTRKLIPSFDKLIVSMTVLATAILFICVIFVDVSFPKMSGSIAALFSVVLIITGLKTLRRGSPTAPYFLIAWSLFLGGILVYLASVFGVVSTNFFTETAMQFGSAAEVILLSLGLAQRIKVDRMLKYEALESKHHSIIKWQQAEKKLLERASYDTLTSLPNSTLLYKCIEDLKAEPNGAIKSFGLVVIHFNRFHEINKTLGKSNADLLLIRASDRLSHEAGRVDNVLPVDRTNDYFHFLSVLDGVSFAVLVGMSSDTQAPNHVAEKLLDVMKKPIEHEGMFIDIDAIAGIALFPIHGQDMDALVQHAAIALETSKKTSQKITTYSSDQNYYSTRRLSLMGDLAKAIESDELTLFLQPQFDLTTSEVVGAEALLRWSHDVHGFVRPDEFIPLAEKSGLIRSLTAWVIERVMQFDKKLQSLGHNIQLSVNISAKNIAEVNFVTNTLDSLVKHGVAPERIVFEMTETTMMDNPEKALSVLNDLSDLGIQLSIDDFGTGYSSLSYLNQLPVDELKIDRSFVTDMVQNSQNQKIVEMTVNLAHTLGLKVVAEGIEDRETMVQLQTLGCDVAQGYFIGRPMPEEAFLSWLEKQSNSKIRSISSRAIK
ncbi:EAL domain-containing protein [Alkalimarinus sediminis]|uniref:cyclic-guanylate-specific phosphodiesterase n=1 Tax=Alkalimarinus sediminis TaxID=1632866 RepID=A0A9E8HK39_9ALTE|nr:EAL domain-containing protein [Alkalimarinus sediminis]UZW74148.1 EAL domain-containing protein [Alkalimarinus sediminis]